MISIRFSEVLAFLKCRRYHKYTFIDEIQPITYNDRILVGTWGHLALKSLLKGGNEDTARELIADDMLQYLGTRNMSNEQADMAELALRCARIGAKRFLAKFEPIYVEEQLTYTLDKWKAINYPDLLLTSTPDVVARERDTGAVWLIDHKFRTNFRPPESELLNLQMIYYSKMLELTKGLVVDGSRQFQIKPIEPKDPKITAEGKVSRQNITTDWETYKKTIEANGEKTSDYLDMKAKLDEKVFFDFETTKALRSKEEIDNVWNNEILPALQDIVTARLNGGEKAYRCFDFSSCKFCSMQEYCVADMKGEDLEYLRRTRFKKKGEVSRQLEILDDEAIQDKA